MAEGLDTKKYIEYLDKEMTIMGILSAVSLIAPGGILSTVLAKERGIAADIWASSNFFIVAGSAMCIIAALCFYRERSTLAWFYGQICLSQVLEKDRSVKVRKLLIDADSWATWWPYSWGFTFLISGFIEFLLATFIYIAPPHWAWLSVHLHNFKVMAFALCPLIALVTAALQWYVLTHYRFSDSYWSDFWADRWHRSLPVLPHTGVYTRLKPSAIHGLGVFAIVDIPQGTYIFEPDDAPTVKVAVDEVRTLPDPIRELYNDFCVLGDNFYESPTSFNQITPSWYLNHSNNPNAAADSELKFYTTREVRAGDELTVDYGTYSENELNSEMR